MAVAVVTGSRGFIGQVVRARLERDGWEVRGVDVRPGPGVRVADVADATRWEDLLEPGCLVVHTAAVVSEQGDEHTFWHVNVRGTRAVVDACARRDAGRLVHLSSVVVHGPDFPDGVDEDGPVHPTGSPYTDTKISSEHLVLAAAAAGRVRATVLRPGDVHGPDSGPWTLRPVHLMRKRLFILIDGGRGLLSPVHVDDVADAVATVADAPQAAGRVLHVTSGHAVSARDFFAPYAEALGVEPRSVPAPVAVAAARPVGMAWRLRGRQPPFGPKAAELLVRRGTYSADRIRRLLGWRAQVSPADGMVATLRRLAESGGLPDDRLDAAIEVARSRLPHLPTPAAHDV